MPVFCSAAKKNKAFEEHLEVFLVNCLSDILPNVNKAASGNWVADMINLR